MSAPLRFYGGTAGAIAPFALFLSGVVWLALSGAPDERGFWPILLAALGLGLALAKDRRRWADVVLSSMAQPIVALMALAWMLAGVLGVLLAEAGLVQSLAWLATEAALGPAQFAGAVFLICAAVSTSTGTSFGTILVAGPLLYPAGGVLAVDPAVLMGAVLAGATWGDSISPVSDTTIATAGSQSTDVAGTVRTRLAYVLPAGLIALVGIMLLGGWTSVASASTSVTQGAVAAVNGSGAALPLLVVPVIVVAMLVRRRHLLEGLFGGIGLTIALSLGLRLLTPQQLFYVDSDAFGAKGLIIDGLERGVGVTVFTLLLMGVVGAVQGAGLLSRWGSSNDGTASGAVAGAHAAGAHAAGAHAAGAPAGKRPAAMGPRQAEWWSVGAASAAVLLTTHSVVAVLSVGPWVKERGERAGLGAYRRANLLDLTVCTWPFLLPYFLPTILASSVTVAGEGFGMPRLSPLTIGLHNVYAWVLLVTVPFVIVTGLGRGVADES